MTAQEMKDVKIRMKPPLSYYGGKQKLSRDICRALYQSPNWDVRGHYIEPYFGGGAVFFAKEPQRMETINDLNDSLIAFYRVVKDPAGFERVKALLDGTLYSRSEFNRAGRILRGEYDASDVAKAWAVFVQSFQSYGGRWHHGWLLNYSPRGRMDAQTWRRKIERLTAEYCERLENAQVDNRNALSVIHGQDRDIALFYLDPPYAGTNGCDYAGLKWTDSDLDDLLETLKALKGRFILSGFPHPLIDAAVAEQGWQYVKKRCAYSMQTTDPAKKAGKVECLISNYPFHLDGWEIAHEYSGEPCPPPQEARGGERQLELLEAL